MSSNRLSGVLSTRTRLIAVGVVGVVALSGCTPSTLIAGSEVTVAVSEQFTSLNPATSFGRSSTTNADVAWLTGSTFAAYDDAGALVPDRSFGEAEIVAEDPLTVQYRVSAGARWSDGTPVDAADLLLAWVANSGALNSEGFDDAPYVDPETGRYTDEFPEDVVFFDGAIGGGMELATQTPQFGDERELFVHFDQYLPTWQTVLVPDIPAHVLIERATGTEFDDARAAKDAVIAAVVEQDATVLSGLARAWNDAYNIDLGAGDLTPEDAELLVSSGPYSVVAVTEAGVTLGANTEYRGDRRPTFETIRVRYSPEPLETVRLLDEGEIDIAFPAPTAETLAALEEVSGVAIRYGSEARFEHLDLQMSEGRTGVFDDPLVREAFLQVVPRQQILEEQVGIVNPDAEVLDSFLLGHASSGYDQVVVANGSSGFGRPNVNSAQALLARAGVSEPRVCVLYDPSSEYRKAEFAALRDSAVEAGFIVTDCSSPDWLGLLGVAGAYDAAIFAWDMMRLGPGAAAAIYRSDSTLANFTRYANPDVDELLDQLERTTDQEERIQLVTEIDSQLFADAYGLPLYAYPTVTAVREGIANVSRSATARGVFWNAWEWAPEEPEE